MLRYRAGGVEEEEEEEDGPEGGGGGGSSSLGRDSVLVAWGKLVAACEAKAATGKL